MNATWIGVAGGVLLGAAGLLIASEVAGGGEVVPGLQPIPDLERFPNVELKTHDGRTVNFFDDLVKGKTVALNFMYARCKDF